MGRLLREVITLASLIGFFVFAYQMLAILMPEAGSQ